MIPGPRHRLLPDVAGGRMEAEEERKIVVAAVEDSPTAKPSPGALSMPPSPTTLPIGFVTVIIDTQTALGTVSLPLHVLGQARSLQRIETSTSLEEIIKDKIMTTFSQV